MSKQRDRIRKAVESRGYQIESLTWEPIYNAGEMSGLAGGWELIVDRPYLPNTIPGDDIYGLSVDELLACIDYDLKPPEPCACDRKHHPLIAASVKGDPQKPTHGPECRWHIPYRLRWWRTDRTARQEKP